MGSLRKIIGYLLIILGILGIFVPLWPQISLIIPGLILIGDRGILLFVRKHCKFCKEPIDKALKMQEKAIKKVKRKVSFK